MPNYPAAYRKASRLFTPRRGGPAVARPSNAPRPANDNFPDAANDNAVERARLGALGKTYLAATIGTSVFIADFDGMAEVIGGALEDGFTDPMLGALALVEGGLLASSPARFVPEVLKAGARGFVPVLAYAVWDRYQQMVYEAYHPGRPELPGIMGPGPLNFDPEFWDVGPNFPDAPPFSFRVDEYYYLEGGVADRDTIGEVISDSPFFDTVDWANYDMDRAAMSIIYLPGVDQFSATGWANPRVPYAPDPMGGTNARPAIPGTVVKTLEWVRPSVEEVIFRNTQTEKGPQVNPARSPDDRPLTERPVHWRIESPPLPGQGDAPHQSQPPKGPNNRDKKFVAQGVRAVRFVGALFGAVTEWDDLVAGIWRSLPKRARTGYYKLHGRGGVVYWKRRHGASLNQMQRDIWENYDQIDMALAAHNVAVGLLQDALIGKLGRAAQQAARSHLQRTRRMVGLGFGPAL